MGRRLTRPKLAQGAARARATARDQLTILTGERDTAQAERAAVVDQAGRLADQLAQITADRDRLGEHVRTADDRIRQLDSAVAAATHRVTDLELAVAGERTARIETETAVRDAQAQATAAERRADRAEAKAEQLEARLTAIGEQLGEARADRDRYRQEATAARDRADRLADQIAQLVTPTEGAQRPRAETPASRARRTGTRSGRADDR